MPVMLANATKGKVNNVFFDPPQLTVPAGSTVRCSIDWANLGAAGTRDLAVFYGTYNPATGELTPAFGWVVTGVHIESGASLVTNIEGVPQVGIWDAAGMVGVYDPATHIFTPDDLLIAEDAVIVVAAAALEVTVEAVPEPAFSTAQEIAVDITAVVKNVGGNDATGVKATLYADPPGYAYIGIGANPQSLGTIAPGTSKSAFWRIYVRLAAEITISVEAVGVDSLTGATIRGGQAIGQPMSPSAIGKTTAVSFAPV